VTTLTSATAQTSTPTRTPRGRIDPRLLVVGGAAAISISSLLIKLADVGPSTAVFFRCFLALPPLLWLAWRDDRRVGQPTRRAVVLRVPCGRILGLGFALGS